MKNQKQKTNQSQSINRKKVGQEKKQDVKKIKCHAERQSLIIRSRGLDDRMCYVWTTWLSSIRIDGWMDEWSGLDLLLGLGDKRSGVLGWRVTGSRSWNHELNVPGQKHQIGLGSERCWPPQPDTLQAPLSFLTRWLDRLLEYKCCCSIFNRQQNC